MIDELDVLRGLRTDVPGPTHASRAQARTALDDAIAATGASRIRTGPHRGRQRHWLPRVAIISVATAICAVVLVLAVSGTGAGPTPALAETLDRLARIAASGPSLVPGPGQYLYVDSEGSSAGFLYSGSRQCITYAVGQSQVWTAADGSGLDQARQGQITFTSAADKAACAPLHLISRTAETSRLWFAAGCSTLGPAPNMQALSTDPRTLLVQMRTFDGGPRTAAEDFVHVGDFLRGTDASPALRAALYRAAALIPGVRLLGTVRDHIGQTGLGVALAAKGIDHELIFNPRTSALMGEETHGSSPGSDSWAVYLQSRVVDELPEASPRPLTPGCVAGAGHVHHVPGGSVITGS